MRQYVWLSLAILLIVGFVCYSSCSRADAVILGGFSYHLQSRQYWTGDKKWNINEVNPALGFRFSETELTYVAYHNSYRRTSLAAYWNPRWNLSEYAGVGLRLGAASGYGDTPVNLDVAPIAGGELVTNIGPLDIVLGFQAPEVLTLHIELNY